MGAGKVTQNCIISSICVYSRASWTLAAEVRLTGPTHKGSLCNWRFLDKRQFLCWLSPFPWLQKDLFWSALRSNVICPTDPGGYRCPFWVRSPVRLVILNRHCYLLGAAGCYLAFPGQMYLATSQSSVPQALAPPREVLRVDTRSPSFRPDREEESSDL